ncbi:MAG: 1-acyl-sn-glycerol-3-phosphate acyltransferase [Lachnospiraceae bacterium]|nr:1-acyl-sn-glycerol-3-phosphate acyltransferase [Lachnospiraceae bacterium]
MKNLVDIENLSKEKRLLYFNRLREKCRNRRISSSPSFVVKMLGGVAKIIRKYELEIINTENIPDGEVIYLCNHSNAHDYFTVLEVFCRLNKKVTPIGGLEGLSWFSRLFLKLTDVVLFKRDSRGSIDKGIKIFCGKILNGKNGLIFGEGTWNIHPNKVMQNLHAGVTEISLITEKPVVPVIFEYIETNQICKKESNIYKKCIVSFGKPLWMTAEKSIFKQTDILQEIMVSMRKEIWKLEGVDKKKLSKEKIRIYLNHTYLKKFKALGFKYDSEKEFDFLLKKGKKIENEYCLDADNNFVPGITDES